MTEQQVEITNRLGLHARAAAKVVHTANSYRSEIFIGTGEEEVNAKSILGLLTLAATRGTPLTVRADGDRRGRGGAGCGRPVRGSSSGKVNEPRLPLGHGREPGNRHRRARGPRDPADLDGADLDSAERGRGRDRAFPTSRRDRRRGDAGQPADGPPNRWGRSTPGSSRRTS